jgi:hypothetical protein
MRVKLSIKNSTTVSDFFLKFSTIKIKKIGSVILISSEV